MKLTFTKDGASVEAIINDSAPAQEKLEAFIRLLAFTDDTAEEIEQAIITMAANYGFRPDTIPWDAPIKGPVPSTVDIYKKPTPYISFCPACRGTTLDKQASCSSMSQRCCASCGSPKPRIGDIIC